MTNAVIPTSRDIVPGTTILLLPLGAWEQHGPHLPLDTDTIIISAVVAHSLARHDTRTECFTVAPVFPITASDEHADFPGGLSTGTQALVDAVVAICRSASTWVAGVLIANGHGGNFDALKAIGSALTHEGITHSVWSLPSYTGGDMHAGHTETSLMMHLRPQSVRVNAIERPERFDVDIDIMRERGVRALSSSGVLGDPTTATPEHGREVLAMYSESLADRLRFCVSHWLTISS